jgi:hypothetical protein
LDGKAEEALAGKGRAAAKGTIGKKSVASRTMQINARRVQLGGEIIQDLTELELREHEATAKPYQMMILDDLLS